MINAKSLQLSDAIDRYFRDRYSASMPVQIDDRRHLIADIMDHVFGDDAVRFLAAPERYARRWREYEHPRSANGRFKERHTADSLQEVHDHINSALNGERSPQSAKKLADFLNQLTVNQLTDLKRQHGISASGRNKAALIERLSDRLDRGRRQPQQQQPPAEQPKSQQTDQQRAASVQAQLSQDLATRPGPFSSRGSDIVDRTGKVALSVKTEASAAAFAERLNTKFGHEASEPEAESTPRDIEFKPHPSSDELVTVDASKLDEAWKNNESYLPKGGQGKTEVPGRRDRFKEFLNTKQPVEASAVSLSPDGTLEFEDGRHRFSVLRDNGHTEIPVTVPAEQVDEFKKRFGSGSTNSDAGQPQSSGQERTPEQQKLFDDHIHIATGMARRQSRHNDPGDMEQIALIELDKASQRFDPSRGVPFENMARNAIKQAFLNDSSKHNAKKRGNNVTRGFATDEEGNREESQVVGSSARPDQQVEQKEQVNRIKEAFSQLDPATTRMLHDVFTNGVSQRDVAKRQGVSTSHVSKTIKAALAATQERLQADPFWHRAEVFVDRYSETHKDRYAMGIGGGIGRMVLTMILTGIASHVAGRIQENRQLQQAVPEPQPEPQPQSEPQQAPIQQPLPATEPPLPQTQEEFNAGWREATGQAPQTPEPIAAPTPPQVSPDSAPTVPEPAAEGNTGSPQEQKGSSGCHAGDTGNPGFQTGNDCAGSHHNTVEEVDHSSHTPPSETLLPQNHPDWVPFSATAHFERVRYAKRHQIDDGTLWDAISRIA